VWYQINVGSGSVILFMKKSIKLFSSKINRARHPLTCSHAKKHLICEGEAYFASGSTRGHPFCLTCGREMILASHEQLNALTQNLAAQVLGRISLNAGIGHTKSPVRPPRSIFKCEVRRATQDLHCSGDRAHPIQRHRVFCFMVSHTGRELSLCPECAEELVVAAHEQLNTLLNAINE
jgi:ribosomal protein S27AE